MTPDEQSANKTTSVVKKTSGITAKDLLIPISIAIAGAFIGIGLFIGGGNEDGVAQIAPTPTNPGQQEQVDNTGKVAEVTSEDWIKGNPDAPVKIVEYSDYDCPFCSRFHDTMTEVVEESNGQVAWVYRHFPLEQLHPQAAAVALAAECVGVEAGNEAFWNFSDSYFEARGARDATPHGELIPRLVTETGVSESAFTTCFENGTYSKDVQEDMANAVATGGRGTPWSIVIGPDGSTYSVNGAQTKQTLLQIISAALGES